MIHSWCSQVLDADSRQASGDWLIIRKSEGGLKETKGAKTSCFSERLTDGLQKDK